MSRITLRIDFDEGRALGPGKVRLLEFVAETGSISGAGRAMDMSYRRAWLLIDALNRTFRSPVVATRGGGLGGGGAELAPFGRSLVARYRAMERQVQESCQGGLEALEEELAHPTAPA